MQWENLTAKDFPKAVRQSKGVCVLATDVMEKHGDQAPVGTDYLINRCVVHRAAAREPCIVFPPYYFTQIHEAKHQPGAIALSAELMWKLLLECCDEISRNGMKKIIIHNFHGGNIHLMPYFVMMLLEKERDYTVYLPQGWSKHPDLEKKMAGIFRGKEKEESFGGHGSAWETSMVMAAAPGTVKLKDTIPGVEKHHGKLDHLPDIMTPVWWYAAFPKHYQGNARPAKQEAGEVLLEGMVRRLVTVVKKVKKDTVAPRLMKEFYGRVKHSFV